MSRPLAKVIGEIGINHNGVLSTALELCTQIKRAGAWAAKFQMRTPEICVPESVRNNPKETPWGTMTYFEYKKRMEFSVEDYEKIDAHCHSIDLPWFASVWDLPSLDKLMKFNPPAIKLASASVTDKDLVLACIDAGPLVIASTGMSTALETSNLCNMLPRNSVIMHSVSEYPTPDHHCNLDKLRTLKAHYYGHPLGYSGHEEDLLPSVLAYAMGAQYIERHVTLDRKTWGTDHSSSLEFWELTHLITLLNSTSKILGDGSLELQEWEMPARAKLRGK
jgi:N-acetylneuraminate synthase